MIKEEFKDFCGPDKWEKFARLREKMHREAVKEYFAELRADAEKRGQTRAVVDYRHVLKDGTFVTKEDIQRDKEINGTKYYPVHESPIQRITRMELEKAAQKRKQSC